MWSIISSLKSHINVKVRYVQIDNLIFKLHYRVTFAILLAGVAIVCAHEYIGERIRCIVKDAVLSHVIETFCFFTSTFTVVRHMNRSVLNRQIPHPGVGPDVDDEEIIRHAYYQWVPFFLSFQAICFYLPHFIWRMREGGRMKALVQGFTILELVDQDKKAATLGTIQRNFNERMFVYRSWTLSLLLCEALNLVNLVLQIYLTDVFLSHQFMDLGANIYWDEGGDEYYPLDIVFPKVTKCTFKKYGPSGTIQYHDTICIMALNVINEKTFTVLWFWYIILFAATVAGLVWRVVSFFAHRSVKFNVVNFNFATQLPLDRNDLRTIARTYSFSEWIFLRYLASNMDGKMFRDLLFNLACSIRTTCTFAESEMILPPREDDSYLLKKAKE